MSPHLRPHSSWLPHQFQEWRGGLYLWAPLVGGGRNRSMEPARKRGAPTTEEHTPARARTRESDYMGRVAKTLNGESADRQASITHIQASRLAPALAVRFIPEL